MLVEVEGFVLTVTYSNGSNISPHRAPLRTFQSYQKPENNGRKLSLDRVSYALLWAHATSGMETISAVDLC